MKEKQILGMIWKCNLCGFCPKEIECPAFDKETRWESSMARGRVAIVHALLQNNDLHFEKSSLARERLFSCTGCSHCYYICPSGIDVPLIITLGRKKLVEANNYPDSHKKIIENIRKYGNPLGAPKPRDSAWPELKENRNAETVYYPGCMAIYRNSEIALNTIKLFEKLGEKIRILKNETCCSGILYRVGHPNLVETSIQLMLDDIRKKPPKRIVFTCPGCLSTFEKIYKSELKERFKGIRLMHFSEYFQEKLTELEINKSKVKEILAVEVRDQIIWHDPCHLARELSIFKEPRAILEAFQIPYLEFLKTGQDANCCGSGAGVRSAYRDLSEQITEQRLSEIENLGAKTILTACPFCEFQYKTVIEKNGRDIDVLDLNTLLEKIL
ncbi:MAG: hypothetical protein GF383_06740 [Candidatus Lokiarchaeota archaeon]|nr:hypothetical protein [Candidatus Lokiarchaeota archaeon]MBD3339814.1 hypothetical protein [Candidatus Lokiarchaeota archaeon]